MGAHWHRLHLGSGNDSGNLLLSLPVIIARREFWDEVFL